LTHRVGAATLAYEASVEQLDTGDGGSAKAADDYRELYTQVCESYRAIDDFRMKLLGLLPVATGAGVLVLLGSGKVDLGATGSDLHRIQQVLAAVAIFGIAITVGLFAYELHGIKKCGRLIKIGARIERHMGDSGPFFGQFATRPHRLAGLIDVPFASSVVYPAAIAVWSFVGFIAVLGWGAVAISAGVLFAFAALSVLACRRLDRELDAWDRSQEIVHRLAADSASNRAVDDVQLFLAVMHAADRPGMSRVGLSTRRAWVIDDAQPLLCPDGSWWSRDNRRPQRRTRPPDIDQHELNSMLRATLARHDLRWPLDDGATGSASGGRSASNNASTGRA
jgi:hypothetical protein